MKLFQIEEPDDSPVDVAGSPGVAVGIDIAPGGIGRVAVAVGGNGEILPDADGERTLRALGMAELLLGLCSRAAKQLARPVTHAVIAADSARDAIEAAAAEAGLIVLSVIGRHAAAALVKGAAVEEAAVLGAAVAAEEAAPAQSVMGYG